MKQCSRCKKKKPIQEFNFKNKSLKIRQKSCRDCTRLEVRNHYKKNRQYYINKSLKRNKEQRKIAQKYIIEYLSTHPCIDCGEKDPVVLEFDHKGDKATTISTMIKDNPGIKKLQQEIEKCEVRCANCHRRKTAKDFNWYKLTQPL